MRFLAVLQENAAAAGAGPWQRLRHLRGKLLSLQLFSWLARGIWMSALLAALYWLLIASDRYVSVASIIIQKTDIQATQSFDFTQVLGGIGGASTRPDQLLLREHLLSIDMLRKLDERLHLRAHYSDGRWDLLSRMWRSKPEIERFYEYFQSRVHIEFDDHAGVLRISTQAYDPQTAFAVTTMLVEEGERFMNQIAHELITVQTNFLSSQVQLAHERLMEARSALLNFQNQKGLVSPAATVASINAIIASLEGKRTELQTQLAAQLVELEENHHQIQRLRQSLEAVEAQIEQERSKLAAPGDEKLSLNYTVEEFQRLEMDVTFAQDVYKTALVGLERGRMEATRTIKKVSILQTPVFPEYPEEPRRIYNAVVTLLFAGIAAGTLKLLEAIVKDHVD